MEGGPHCGRWKGGTERGGGLRFAGSFGCWGREALGVLRRRVGRYEAHQAPKNRSPLELGWGVMTGGGEMPLLGRRFARGSGRWKGEGAALPRLWERASHPQECTVCSALKIAPRSDVFRAILCSSQPYGAKLFFWSPSHSPLWLPATQLTPISSPPAP